MPNAPLENTSSTDSVDGSEDSSVQTEVQGGALSEQAGKRTAERACSKPDCLCEYYDFSLSGSLICNVCYHTYDEHYVGML